MGSSRGRAGYKYPTIANQPTLRLKEKRATLFDWSIVNPTQCALIIYFVNGFGPISGVDESNIVKEAVLLLQSKQVRL